jgi:hypothetical protein
MRSSSLVFVAVLAAFGGVAAASGCSSETDGAGGSSASSASGSSQASNGSTGSSMAGSGGESGTTASGSGGGAASSSSSSGAGGEAPYSSCGDCTNTGDGAPTKECAAQNMACTKDQGCEAIRACWNNCPSTDKAGGCCTLDCYMSSGASQASIDLFKAYDKCVYCTTCKTLCTDPPAYDASEYCKVVEGVSTCP